MSDTMIIAEFPGSEAWSRFITNCLAVVGGFIAGYLIGAVGSWAVDKWVFAKRSPDAAKKAISVLCGILLAILVGFLVFGDGGGPGWFGGGEGSKGAGTNGADDGKQPKPDPAPNPKTPPKIDSPKTPDGKSDGTKIRITFLGGDAVQGDRFYLFEDDTAPKSFDELKALILKRKDSSAATLTIEAQFPSDPQQRIDPSSINVAQVRSWANGQGIRFTQ